MKCVCDPLELYGHQFNSFIGENFKVCAYTARDIIAFSAGLINIAFWLFAQSPQLYTTFQNKSGGNISWAFLIIWLVGDVANLIGCIFTNQAQVQLYTAIYFIIMDGIVLAQIIYYETYYKWQMKKKQAKIDEGIQDVHKATEKTPLSPNSPYQSNNFAPTVGGTRTPLPMDRLANVAIVTLSIIALSNIDFASATPLQILGQLFLPRGQMQASAAFSTLEDKLPLCNDSGDLSATMQVIGTICAWVCGILYFTARIPQAWKIYQEKNAYGVSFALFAMSFAANCFYALSILLPDTADFKSVGFWRDTFAYLIGSLGANVFSGIVMFEIYVYGQKPPEDDEKHSEEAHHDLTPEHSLSSNQSSANKPTMVNDLSLDIREPRHGIQ